jgi:hypothetical protein
MFDKLMHDAQATLRSPEDAEAFVRVLVSDGDELDMLLRMVRPTELGARRLQEALTHDESPRHVNEVVVELLAWLGREEFELGPRKNIVDKVLLKIYECLSVFGMLSAVLETVQADLLKRPAVIRWFMMRVGLASAAARNDDPIFRELAQALGDDNDNAARGDGALHVLLGYDLDDNDAAAPSLADIQVAPGGRHDNDHADFRSIEIVPTAEEALCEAGPFLPLATDKVRLSTEAGFLDHSACCARMWWALCGTHSPTTAGTRATSFRQPCCPRCSLPQATRVAHGLARSSCSPSSCRVGTRHSG